MVKRRNVAITQLLIQWRGQEIEDATWEDYTRMATRYPDFILEVEKGFKEGGLSATEADLGPIQVNFDLVKGIGEGGEKQSRTVSDQGSDNLNEESLSSGGL